MRIIVSMKRDYLRNFTDVFPKWVNRKDIGKSLEHYFSLYLVVLFIFLLMLSIGLYRTLETVREKYKQEQERLSYWQDVVKKHPHYPDGYYEAGLVAGGLKEKKQAVEYLNKAIELDPSFEKAKKLRENILKQWWF